MSSAAVKVSRRQRLDEEYRDLKEGERMLCSYGPSLITVIFNAETIVDATLFFISGGHLRYKFTPSDENPGVLEVKFSNPRIPSSFGHLLPRSEEIIPKKPRKIKPVRPEGEKRRTSNRTRKRCAFFNILISRRGRITGEADIVNLSAEVKLFNYTVHVCGLRDSQDAEMAMRIIHQALVNNQNELESNDPETVKLLADGNLEREAFLASNNRCCSIPLVLSEGDVVMTNICGKFTRSLNLRSTYTILSSQYPAVMVYLTTMSKSNYLAITLFEHPPFDKIQVITTIPPDELREIKEARHQYLMSGKKARSKLRKHTFFVHASGRFIQSSRNNATALQFTSHCMNLLYTVTKDVEPPVIIDDTDNDEESESDSEEDD